MHSTFNVNVNVKKRQGGGGEVSWGTSSIAFLIWMLRMSVIRSTEIFIMCISWYVYCISIKCLKQAEYSIAMLVVDKYLFKN